MVQQPRRRMGPRTAWPTHCTHHRLCSWSLVPAHGLAHISVLIEQEVQGPGWSRRLASLFWAFAPRWSHRPPRPRPLQTRTKMRDGAQTKKVKALVVTAQQARSRASFDVHEARLSGDQQLRVRVQDCWEYLEQLYGLHHCAKLPAIPSATWGLTGQWPRCDIFLASLWKRFYPPVAAELALAFASGQPSSIRRLSIG
mmetsp:Transcript_98504/g.246834  ORF Transcript_98504/g.246834 Transcript_98504/m.246834 type:complete len:198 (-) Transcript_98504:25-618(-)